MRLARAPYLDEYAVGDELVVLLSDHRVLALSPVLTELMRLIDAGVTDSDEIARQLVQTFGEVDRNLEADNSEGDIREPAQVVPFALEFGLLTSVFPES